MGALKELYEDPEKLKKFLLNEAFVDEFLRHGEMTYKVMKKFDILINKNKDQFKNNSTVVDYLSDLYDDIITTEAKVDRNAQKRILNQLRLYEFLNRIQAKYKDFDELLDKLQKEPKYRILMESTSMMRNDLTAQEFKEMITELDAKKSKSSICR